MTDEHLIGLPPALVAQIKKLAAELVAAAPPLTPEQVKNLSAIFRSADAASQSEAA